MASTAAAAPEPENAYDEYVRYLERACEAARREPAEARKRNRYAATLSLDVVSPDELDARDSTFVASLSVPVRCYTCGSVIGTNENVVRYLRARRRAAIESRCPDPVMTQQLHDMGLLRYCCRLRFVSALNLRWQDRALEDRPHFLAPEP